MVNQVPGFQLEGGFNNNRVRGFANTAGNVLIDDRRPSAKRDSLGNILTRIPAASVERIELIRGQVRGIDNAAINDLGIAGYELMKRAANAVLIDTRKKFPLTEPSITFVAFRPVATDRQLPTP